MRRPSRPVELTFGASQENSATTSSVPDFLFFFLRAFRPLPDEIETLNHPMDHFSTTDRGDVVYLKFQLRNDYTTRRLCEAASVRGHYMPRDFFLSLLLEK